MPHAIKPFSKQLMQLSLLLASLPAMALEQFIQPPDDIDLIGQVRQIEALHEDTLLDIARRYHLGHDEIVIANPDVDRWMPGGGTPITLPTRYVLPKAVRRGVVLNVPEMRLYFFAPATKESPARVETYPVSVGRMDWATPLGDARIVRKDVAPSWRPPESIKKEAAERGERLPDVVPPGPKNPLGNYALRLSVPGYLIHGTDKPWGIGMRVTHGCVRMYPEDIEQLFPRLSVGNQVQIVNQPVKAGWFADTLYLEVHPPLEEDIAGLEAIHDTAMAVVHQALAERPGRTISGRAFNQAILEKTGMPIPISLP